MLAWNGTQNLMRAHACRKQDNRLYLHAPIIKNAKLHRAMKGCKVLYNSFSLFSHSTTPGANGLENKLE